MTNLDEQNPNARRYAAAKAYIKSGEYDKALGLYNEPEALPSDRRVIQREIEKDKAVRHSVSNRSD